MNRRRITMNLVLAVGSAAGGIALLLRRSFFLPGRWPAEPGLYFTGSALVLLALGELFLQAAATKPWFGHDSTVTGHPGF